VLRWDGDGGAPANACAGKEGQPGCELRQPVHWHADFAVFIRGQRFDFSVSPYVSHEGDELSPDVHIHDPRHTVVHVHREQTTWDAFFRSLGFELTDPTIAGVTPATSCLKLPTGEKLCSTTTETFKFYVNGVRVDGVAASGIADLERTLISYGPETPEQVVQTQLTQVTDQACIPSELCLERRPVDEPPEPCTRSGDTCN
jgi:hypothetical protein